MICTEIGTAKTVELLDEGLVKVANYVNSVGFCINPSKSEVLITCKKKARLEFGEKLTTALGEITIKKVVNFLGLRIDHDLTFKPQFTHLMGKITVFIPGSLFLCRAL